MSTQGNLASCLQRFAERHNSSPPSVLFQPSQLKVSTMLSNESPHTLHTNVTFLSLSSAYFCQIPPAAVLQRPSLRSISQPCLLTGSQPPPCYDSAVCPKPPCSRMSSSLPFSPRSLSSAFQPGGFINILPYTIQWLPGSVGVFLFLVYVLMLSCLSVLGLAI